MRDYILKFEGEQLYVFNGILERLDPEDYDVRQAATPGEIAPNRQGFVATLAMDEQTALTFRMGMRRLDMKLVRTAEEQAALDSERASKTVRIKVNVDTGAV